MEFTRAILQAALKEENSDSYLKQLKTLHDNVKSIRRRMLLNDEDHDKIDARLKRELDIAQEMCPHPDTKCYTDPSGGNDHEFHCLICGNIR